MAEFTPHRESVSVAVLFTRLGDLQIFEPGLDSWAALGDDQSGWRWVKPVPGHVIVNLGDGLPVLTNEVLKSGFHRVVAAAKAQGCPEKFSVFLGYRPALITLMRPLARSDRGERVD